MDETKIDKYMVDPELIQAVMLKGDLPELVSEHVESVDLFKFVELFYEMDFLNAVAFLARKYKISP